MTQLALTHVGALQTSAVPALVTAAGDRAGLRFLEFFAAQTRNPHTRRAYRGHQTICSKLHVNKVGRSPRSFAAASGRVWSRK